MLIALFQDQALPPFFMLWVLTVVTFSSLIFYYSKRTSIEKKPMPWRKVALYGALAVFVGFCVSSEPLFRAVVYYFYGVSERVIGDNASAEQVAADHVIGGWVQVGTLLSKLFAAISFYITSYTLPWLLQRSTHPVLTDWAKEKYEVDFYNLTAVQRFEVYGRLQTNQSIRWAASLLAAALLV